jgi:hypothetical protein
MTILAAAVLGFFTMTAQTDTTLPVRPGFRLEVNNFGGEVAIASWDKNAVRIEADHGSSTVIRVESLERGLRVASSGRRGPPGSVEYRITVPSWMPVVVTGPFNDVSIAGTRSDITVETVRGDVNVEGGSGFINLSTVQGLVSLARSRGRIKLSSVNEGVSASDIAGQVSAETVNGDVTLDRIDSDAVDASSVCGSLTFLGPLHNPGRYRLQTHSGDIQVLLPEKPNAEVSVETFSGSFDSDFDVHLNALKGSKSFQFVLGMGGPQLDLEAFSGSIRLVHKAELLEHRQELLERRQELMERRQEATKRREELRERIREKTEKVKQKRSEQERHPNSGGDE